MGTVKEAAQSSAQDGKLALLFLIKEGPNNPGVWRRWLQDAPADRYSITVHAKHTDLVHAEQFKRNWMFVLLSDACLPIVSFETARSELMEAGGEWSNDKSCFHLHADKQQRDQRRYFKRFVDAQDEADADSEEVQLLKDIIDEHAHAGVKPKPAIWAHSQWCILSRRHAEILCDPGEDGREEKRRKVWLSAYAKALSKDDVDANLTLAPDELFILSYLRDYERRTGLVIKVDNRTVTYGRCCIDAGSCQCGPERAKHPQAHKNLQYDFVKSCDLNMALFARKFNPGVEDGERWVWWRRLWEAWGDTLPQRVEERSKLAQMCHWEMQMRDAAGRTKPTSRQQQELASYVSSHPVPESWQDIRHGGEDTSDDDAPVINRSRHVSPSLPPRGPETDSLRAYIQIVQSSQLDSEKMSTISALLRTESDQGVLSVFREAREKGKWVGTGEAAHFQGVPEWSEVAAALLALMPELSAKKKRKKEEVQKEEVRFQSCELAAVCQGPLKISQMPALVQALRSITAISDALQVLRLLCKNTTAKAGKKVAGAAEETETEAAGTSEGASEEAGQAALLEALVREGGLLVLSKWVTDEEWSRNKGYAMLLERMLEALELTPFAKLGSTSGERQQALAASRILPELQERCRRDFKGHELNRRRKALVAKIKLDTSF
eukprot:Tamp_08723.p1 GENE.Tamp_08723~~Tamp_08723.p1  ORF type:complete len:665 (-),score=164.39 Tamp_08723:203-2197(-)